MKTLLLFTFLSFSFLQINAQCTEAASSFGNNTLTPSYNVQGDISVTLNTNNTVIINFANNYKTASGPDVRVYLIKSKGKTIEQLKSIKRNGSNDLVYKDPVTQNENPVENIKFGLVGFSGAQSYTETLPSNIDISQYDTVFFFCLQFSAFWDASPFTPFTSNNCSVLDVTAFSLDDVSIYPNPAKDKIHFTNLDANSTEVRIFNALGKQVFYQPKLTDSAIDVSQFNNGVYLVKVTGDGKSRIQKLVIQ
jgi:hypothetical protein